MKVSNSFGLCLGAWQRSQHLRGRLKLIKILIEDNQSLAEPLASRFAVTGKLPWPTVASGLAASYVGLGGLCHSHNSWKDVQIENTPGARQGKGVGRGIYLSGTFSSFSALPAHSSSSSTNSEICLEWNVLDEVLDLLDRDILQADAMGQWMNPKCWHFKCYLYIRKMPRRAVSLSEFPQYLICNSYLCLRSVWGLAAMVFGKLLKTKIP